MKTIYHGTSKKHLQSIIQNGLWPTEKSKVDSHWEIQSGHDRVYLSDTYALYYALCSGSETDSNPIVLKLSVNEDDLLPDEDYMAQLGFLDGTGLTGNLKKDTEIYRDGIFDMYCSDVLNNLGKGSLQNMGTCCIKSGKIFIESYIEIPKEQINRYILEDCDPSVSIVHHRFLSESYKATLHSLFLKLETKYIDKEYSL